LKESFSKVPIGLKLLGGPINTGSPSIFQMNIQQSRQFGEYIQIWPGDRNNEIEVVSTDGAPTMPYVCTGEGIDVDGKTHTALVIAPIFLQSCMDKLRHPQVIRLAD
jgi:hypothetical protein